MKVNKIIHVFCIFALYSLNLQASNFSQLICGVDKLNEPHTLVGFRMPVNEALKIDRLKVVLSESFTSYQLERLIKEKRIISFAVSYPEQTEPLESSFKINQLLEDGARRLEVNYGNDKVPWVSDKLSSKISSIDESDDQDKTANLDFSYSANSYNTIIGNITTTIEGNFALYTHRYNDSFMNIDGKKRKNQRFTEENQLKFNIMKHFYSQLKGFSRYVEFALGIQENNSHKMDRYGFMLSNQEAIHSLTDRRIYNNVPTKALSSKSGTASVEFGFNKNFVFGSRCNVKLSSALTVNYDSRGFSYWKAGATAQFSVLRNDVEYATWVGLSGKKHNAHLIIGDTELDKGVVKYLDFNSGQLNELELGLAVRKGQHQLSLTTSLQRGENYNPQIYNNSATEGDNKTYSEIKYTYYLSNGDKGGSSELNLPLDVLDRPIVILSSF